MMAHVDPAVRGRPPMTVVCLVPDAHTARVCTEWAGRPEFIAGLIVRSVSRPPPTPSHERGGEHPDSAPLLEVLKRDVEAQVGEQPYAILAVGEGVRVTRDLVRVLRTPYPVTRVFLAGAVPPTDPEGAFEVPVSVLCGARDPVAPPEVMSGWQSHCGAGFSVQVFDEAADFLLTRAEQVVQGIAEDLRIQPVSQPGRGFAAVGDGRW